MDAKLDLGTDRLGRFPRIARSTATTWDTGTFKTISACTTRVRRSGILALKAINADGVTRTRLRNASTRGHQVRNCLYGDPHSAYKHPEYDAKESESVRKRICSFGRRALIGDTKMNNDQKLVKDLVNHFMMENLLVLTISRALFDAIARSATGRISRGAKTSPSMSRSLRYHACGRQMFRYFFTSGTSMEKTLPSTSSATRNLDTKMSMDASSESQTALGAK